MLNARFFNMTTPCSCIAYNQFTHTPASVGGGVQL